MLLQLSELLARTSWLITALVLAGCAAQPAPDCRTPETCPPLVALPDPEPGLQTFQPAAHVSVDLTQPPSNISDTLFGLFFEEVCKSVLTAVVHRWSELGLSKGFCRSCTAGRAASMQSWSRTGASRDLRMHQATQLASWSPRT